METVFQNSVPYSRVFLLYRISYLWFSMIGCLITVLVGLITSLITGVQEPGRLDEALVSPPIRSLIACLPNSIKRKLRLPIQVRLSGIYFRRWILTVDIFFYLFIYLRQIVTDFLISQSIKYSLAAPLARQFLLSLIGCCHSCICYFSLVNCYN